MYVYIHLGSIDYSTNTAECQKTIITFLYRDPQTLNLICFGRDIVRSYEYYIKSTAASLFY